MANSFLYMFYRVMKLLPIKNIYTSAKQQVRKMIARTEVSEPEYGLRIKAALEEDVFTLTNPVKEELRHLFKINAKKVYSEIVQKYPKFDLAQYKQLTLEELHALRTLSKGDSFDTAKVVVKSTRILKEIFDKRYGEGNWVFVSIGRSPATIAKCLEYMGVESKLVPLSGLSGVPPSELKYITEQFRFDKYRKYLDSIGLSLHDVKNSKKKYLFADFSVTGSSLKYASSLFRSRALGLKSSNVKFVDLSKIMTNYQADRVSKGLPKSSVIDYFRYNLKMQFLDDYAPIKSLNFKDLRKIDYAVNSPLETRARLLQFNMMDILNNL